MGVPTVTISSGATILDRQYEVVAVDVSLEVDRIPEARIVLIDGDAAQGKFPISDTGFFAPGNPLEIKLRYEGEPDTSVFQGLVLRHAVESGDVGSALVVEAKD